MLSCMLGHKKGETQWLVLKLSDSGEESYLLKFSFYNEIQWSVKSGASLSPQIFSIKWQKKNHNSFGEVGFPMDKGEGADLKENIHHWVTHKFCGNLSVWKNVFAILFLNRIGGNR